MSGMIDALMATANKHLAVDELDLAEQRLLEAAARLEAEQGPSHEGLIRILETLAGLNWLPGSNERAREFANRAIHIRSLILSGF